MHSTPRAFMLNKLLAGIRFWKAANPKGIASQSPGLEMIHNRDGVEISLVDSFPGLLETRNPGL